MNLVINKFKAFFFLDRRSIISALSLVVYFTVLLLLLKVIIDINLVP